MSDPIKEKIDVFVKDVLCTGRQLKSITEMNKLFDALYFISLPDRDFKKYIESQTVAKVEYNKASKCWDSVLLPTDNLEEDLPPTNTPTADITSIFNDALSKHLETVISNDKLNAIIIDSIQEPLQKLVKSEFDTKIAPAIRKQIEIALFGINKNIDDRLTSFEYSLGHKIKEVLISSLSEG